MPSEAATSARLHTRLRRPAQLHLDPVPFVPPVAAGVRARAESRWAALVAANPAYHDGRVCHVLGVHRNGHGGATLHVADCAYRFFAVQDAALDLGVRPLGVKGIVRRGDAVLVGRRPRWVAGHPGAWELAPSGTVEPGEDPAHTVARELEEETGLRAAAPPVACAILFDASLRCWELAFELTIPLDAQPEPREYDELAWCMPEALPAPLSPVATAMRPLLAPRE